MKFNSAGPVGKNGPKFWSASFFPKFEAPWVGDTCPTCLKIAGEALGLLGCVLKRLKILMKFNSAGPVGKNGPKFWSALFPQIWSPLSRGPALQPTCLKIAGEALGLLGCVLKRLKILMKFNSAGPVEKNGPKFWWAPFPQIWSPLRPRASPRPIRLCVEKT